MSSASLPTGTVTFMFTDVQGSTRLWQDFGDAMQQSLERHDDLIRAAVGDAHGYVFATAGDSFSVAFAGATEAVACAIGIQRALLECDWNPGPELKVRIGMHSGIAQERGGNYFGGDVSMAARVMSVAHGGQILVSPATASLAAGVELLALGEHRLRDIDGSHALAQVVAEGLPREFPTIRTEMPETVRLPSQRSPLIGRDDEITTIRRLLVDHRLVTLAGPGGAGKTRLAIEVAARQVDRTRGGVFFVDLAPVTDANGLINALVQACGLAVDPRAPARDHALAWLARREATLVVDNCEHIIDDAAELIDDILSVAPDVRIIATSRESLGLDDERTVRVGGLGANDGGSPAVQLFCERAARITPDFAASASDMEAIIEICDHLDGIPLAIELAAGRVRTLDPVGIRDRLDDRFRLLTGSRKASRRRQATLERTIDWSYDLLDPEEQSLLRHLAVFPASFDLEAAAAIGGIDDADALDLLDALVDKSLLNPTPGIATREFRMLETIREYAMVKLIDRDESVDARDRHAAYWRQWLVADDDALVAFVRLATPERFAMVRARPADLVAMLTWLWEQDRIAELAWPAILLTQPVWIPEGRVREGSQWLERCADSIPADPDVRFWFEFSRAWLAVYAGDPDAVGRLAAARDCAPATTRPLFHAAQVRFLETAVRLATGMDTREFAEETVEIGRRARAECDDAVGRAAYSGAFAFRGAARSVAGDFAFALDDYSESIRSDLGLNFEIGHWVRIGEVACLHLAGRHTEARSAALRLLEIRHTLAAEWNFHLDIVAWIARAGDGEDPHLVRSAAVERLEAERGHATAMWVHSLLSLFGILAVLCDEPERARRLFEHTIGIGFAHSAALHWHYVAQVEEWPQAEQEARRAAHFWSAFESANLPAATAILEQEMERLLAT